MDPIWRFLFAVVEWSGMTGIISAVRQLRSELNLPSAMKYPTGVEGPALKNTCLNRSRSLFTEKRSQASSRRIAIGCAGGRRFAGNGYSDVASPPRLFLSKDQL